MQLGRSDQKPVLEVIIFSTRPGRVGLPVGHWIYEKAKGDGRFDVRLVDLKEVNLPFLDEPKHPRFGEYEHEHTKRWSEIVSQADAFVFVVPEYNFGMSGATKNAIDFLHKEWNYKPVGFVSYGGISGGIRAVQTIKQVVTTVKMVPLVEAVHIPFVQNFIKDGQFCENQELDNAAKIMFEELFRWVQALKTLRT